MRAGYDFLTSTVTGFLEIYVDVNISKINHYFTLSSYSIPFETPANIIQMILTYCAVNNMACHLKSCFCGNREPFFWTVFPALSIDHSNRKALIIEKGMDDLFEIVRVHVVAFDGMDKLHRCAEIGAFLFRVAQSFLDACSGEANFYEILAMLPRSQFWGSRQGFQNVDIAREVMVNVLLLPGCLLDNREQGGCAVEPLALLVRV